MTQVHLFGVGRYDALYLSPHGDDAALACLGRIRAERARGDRVLVLALFESESSPLAEAVSELGIDVALAGLAPASQRRSGAPYRSIGFERAEPDSDVFEAIVRILADIGPRVRPRQVYVPLGIGGHIDHRLVHEAALQVLPDEHGRNVFLYEERPEAFAPGAVRVRLGLLGARLPPGAADAAEWAGLTRYLMRVHAAPLLRGDVHGWSDRFGSYAPAAGEWRSARVWNSQKAFGPRLQPVVHSADAEALDAVLSLGARLLPALGSRDRAPERWRAAASTYSRKLGGADYAERYWLLLPNLPGATQPARREELEEAAVR
jgi:LmbE family N-acetylglucosaminyl deacetylase